MTTPTPATPRGDPIHQLTIRIYDRAEATSFEAVAARIAEGKGRAAHAVFAAGLAALATAPTTQTASSAPATPTAPESVTCSISEALAGQMLQKSSIGAAPPRMWRRMLAEIMEYWPFESSPSARKRIPEPAPAACSPNSSNLGVVFGGLALAVSITALGAAIYRTPAATAPAPLTGLATASAPAAPVPDLSAFATRANLDKVKADLDKDLDEIGLVIREVQEVNRQQTVRLDKLSPAPKPATPPGR